MSGFDMVSMAVRNLWKRKLRTFLTVLGVIIGTASIVVMLSVGIGMNEGFKEQIGQMGSLNVIDVYTPWSGDSKEVVTLDNKTIEEIRNIKGVEVVSPVINEYFILIDGKYVCDTSIIGIDPSAMEAMGYKISWGRALQEGDSMCAVAGSYVKEDFYNPKQNHRYRWSGTNTPDINFEDDKFKVTTDYSYGTNYADKKIKPLRLTIVGEMDPNDRYSYNTFMPLKDVEALIDAREKANGVAAKDRRKKGVYDNLKVKVEKMDDVDGIQEQIRNMGFEANSLKEYLNSMQETSKMLQMVLGAIGAISLLVAAIGITNTMVMSIYERTREIGVMKVIGATLNDIKRLFLVEAAFIGFFGGIAGIAVSFLASYITNNVAASLGQSSTLSMIPPWLAISGVVFATFIGVLAGYLPAKRATNLSALAAIRTE
ncbi:MAG: ABC transporter permease [Firmicutes bacterium]|nr:ABC transporter permease [Bacillota bacterium]